jgi:hypothetical protein
MQRLKQTNKSIMSTRSTSNQYSWSQFAERERNLRETNPNGTAFKESDDYNDVDTPRRRSTRKPVETQSAIPTKSKNSKKRVTISTPVSMTRQVVTHAVNHVTPVRSLAKNQPVRTRAQKRLADAAEAIVQLQQAQVPEKPKTRRTDYLVKCHDKIRQSARLLKLQTQE